MARADSSVRGSAGKLELLSRLSGKDIAAKEDAIFSLLKSERCGGEGGAGCSAQCSAPFLTLVGGWKTWSWCATSVLCKHLLRIRADGVMHHLLAADTRLNALLLHRPGVKCEDLADSVRALKLNEGPADRASETLAGLNGRPSDWCVSSIMPPCLFCLFAH